MIDWLNWRYATKRMNGKEIPPEKLDKILEAIRLAPSSYGLQPYKIWIIRDQDLKNQILPIARGQRQVVECSHLLVFAVRTSITEEEVDAYLEKMQKVRGTPPDRLERIKQVIMTTIRSRSDAILFQWNARQAYIALGYATIAAAAEKVDSVPMEGFDSDALDQLLGLPEKGYRSVLLLPLGYRDETSDHLAGLPKVRKSREELFELVDKHIMEQVPSEE